MDRGNNKIRVRFAPSPTGYLHIGNVRTALFNWLFARHNQGDFILRIEDTDLERSSREYEKGVLQDLSWLGLDWDEGPDIGGEYGPYRQSERLNLYKSYAHKLLEEGKAYYCFCSSEELQEERSNALKEGRPPRYSGKCRKLSPDKVEQALKANQPAALRFKVNEGIVAFTDLVRGKISFDTREIGDFIILRSDGIPPYNFAVVIDDNLMQINYVIRGEDHISNTPKQILLYKALGFPLPQFAHLSMILGKDRTPLSKRHGVTSLAQFRKAGFLPDAMRNYLTLLGWSSPDEEEILSTSKIIAEFSLSRVSRSPAIFDIDKLKWMNANYLRKMDHNELVSQALPYLRAANYLDQEPDEDTKGLLAEMIEAVSDHISTLAELPEELKIFFHFDVKQAIQSPEIKQMFEQEKALKVIEKIFSAIENTEELSFDLFKEIAVAVGKEVGSKGSELYHPIRAAITGKFSGPELKKIIPILEKGNNLTRIKPIKSCAQRLKEFIFAVKNEILKEK
jgi:nondiscriminating glutamyl-tRNA synthetase